MRKRNRRRPHPCSAPQPIPKTQAARPASPPPAPAPGGGPARPTEPGPGQTSTPAGPGVPRRTLRTECGCPGPVLLYVPAALAVPLPRMSYRCAQCEPAFPPPEADPACGAGASRIRLPPSQHGRGLPGSHSTPKGSRKGSTRSLCAGHGAAPPAATAQRRLLLAQAPAQTKPGSSAANVASRTGRDGS